MLNGRSSCNENDRANSTVLYTEYSHTVLLIVLLMIESIYVFHTIFAFD